ncbi:unnamed protein product [Calicophoron daubneyi]|uniref:Uncharacterized protein n=1 Tax=Calicophoron daubneyi TaxID=300641 RepID=A0AAV2T1T0_CALDB
MEQFPGGGSALISVLFSLFMTAMMGMGVWGESVDGFPLKKYGQTNEDTVLSVENTLKSYCKSTYGTCVQAAVKDDWEMLPKLHKQPLYLSRLSEEQKTTLEGICKSFPVNCSPFYHGGDTTSDLA